MRTKISQIRSRSARRATASTYVLLLAIGCGGGGSGGCGTPGSTSECGPGDICSNIQGDGNQCRQICTTQAECPPGENCEGIANTTLKSCQPVLATPTPMPQATPTPKK